jgi:hypothetical protein
MGHSAIVSTSKSHQHKENTVNILKHMDVVGAAAGSRT